MKLYGLLNSIPVTTEKGCVLIPCTAEACRANQKKNKKKKEPDPVSIAAVACGAAAGCVLSVAFVCAVHRKLKQMKLRRALRKELWEQAKN